MLVTQYLIGEQIMHDRKERDTRTSDKHPPKILIEGFRPKRIKRDKDGNPLPVKPRPKKP